MDLRKLNSCVPCPQCVTIKKEGEEKNMCHWKRKEFNKCSTKIKQRM